MAQPKPAGCAPPKCGGMTNEKEPNEDTHDITAKIKHEVEQKVGQKYHDFKAVKMTTQLVNGVNHFIKVHTGADNCLHIRVHKSFQGDLTLAGVQTDKKLADPLDYF